ncbi:MAG: minor capsid protein [Defluviitaleaceae bacterium]|nr:minor capsid protein [Defluviitaleaceae bacterium]
MDLTDVGELLRGFVDCEVSVHTINRNFQHTLGVYPRRGGTPYNPDVGIYKAYDFVPVTLLLRWGRNGAEAEGVAGKLYSALEDAVLTWGIVVPANNAPVWLGADQRGVFEYSIDVNFYVKN